MATTSRKRIYLSVPHMGPNEERYVHEAFTSNWLSTVGPNLDERGSSPSASGSRASPWAAARRPCTSGCGCWASDQATR
jgi:hypothetical protein